jgi:hypothetical protein
MYEIVLSLSDEDSEEGRTFFLVNKYTLDEHGIIRTEFEGKSLIIRDWVYIQEF